MKWHTTGQVITNVPGAIPQKLDIPNQRHTSLSVHGAHHHTEDRMAWKNLVRARER